MASRSEPKFSVFHVPRSLLNTLQLSTKLNRTYTAKAPTKPANQYSTPSTNAQHAPILQKFASMRVARPTCHTCGGVEFANVEEQRSHFRSAWHQGNMAKKMEWRRRNADKAVDDSEYPWEPAGPSAESQDGQSQNGQMPDSSEQSEPESIWSESDASVVDETETPDRILGENRASAESSDEDGSDGQERVTSPYLWFISNDDEAACTSAVEDTAPIMATVYGVQRRVLQPKGSSRGASVDAHQILEDLVAMQLPPAPQKTHQELKLEKQALKQKASSAADEEDTEGPLKKQKSPFDLDPQSSLWTILALNGGFFAGAVFDNRTGTMLAHKTFQRYTTRRKQGGLQSRQDNAMGRGANSAGAQIRRYNEQKLQEEIRELMHQWQPLLQKSTRVFVRVSKYNQRGFFAAPNDAPPIVWSDDRIRSVPVPMARPTLAELQRVYAAISMVRVRQVDLTQMRRVRRQRQVSDAVLDESEPHSEHTLEPVPQPELLAFLYHVAKMMLDDTQTDEQIVDYLCEHLAQLLDALGDPAIGLRYLETTDALLAHRTPTLLHLASQLGRASLIPFLMDNGEDPTITNGHPPLFSGGITAYEIAKDRRTRDAFRVYRAQHEGEVDGIEWERTRVPEPLSEERLRLREEKAREKKRRDRERTKQRKRDKQREHEQKIKETSESDQVALDQAMESNRVEKEKEESLEANVHKMSQSELRARMLSLAYASAADTWHASAGRKKKNSNNNNIVVEAKKPSVGAQRAIDRELRLRALERRMAQEEQQAGNSRQTVPLMSTEPCTHCGKSLHGLVPFEQFDWKCCSVECLHDQQELYGV
ncbi:hypothetical protein GGI26_000982 [Coemansia sp. RSA 1358]|nr:hypothetical protein EDC05_000726 [Coemansia umbellata]KAJ2625179.1 hypothetical protein GGI26_000982 [Coemansia sp. RSA 1358]